MIAVLKTSLLMLYVFFQYTCAIKGYFNRMQQNRNRGEVEAFDRMSKLNHEYIKIFKSISIKADKNEYESDELLIVNTLIPKRLMTALPDPVAFSKFFDIVMAYTTKPSDGFVLRPVNREVLETKGRTNGDDRKYPLDHNEYTYEIWPINEDTLKGLELEPSSYHAKFSSDTHNIVRFFVQMPNRMQNELFGQRVYVRISAPRIKFLDKFDPRFISTGYILIDDAFFLKRNAAFDLLEKIVCGDLNVQNVHQEKLLNAMSRFLDILPKAIRNLRNLRSNAINTFREYFCKFYKGEQTISAACIDAQVVLAARAMRIVSEAELTEEHEKYCEDNAHVFMASKHEIYKKFKCFVPSDEEEGNEGYDICDSAVNAYKVLVQSQISIMEAKSKKEENYVVNYAIKMASKIGQYVIPKSNSTVMKWAQPKAMSLKPVQFTIEDQNRDSFRFVEELKDPFNQNNIIITMDMSKLLQFRASPRNSAKKLELLESEFISL